MSDSRLNEEDVLLAFAVEPLHDLGTLERYLRQYPEFAAALIDCSRELEISPSAGGTVEKTDVVAADKAWARFQSLVQGPVSVVPNPFAQLNSAAFRKLAAELNINTLLLMRLRDRAVRFATIPGEFVRMLAQKLGVSTGVMGAHLNGMPILAEGVQYKAAEKPTAGPQIDFAEAVKSSQLSDTQQQALLALRD